MFKINGIKIKYTPRATTGNCFATAWATGALILKASVDVLEEESILELKIIDPLK